MPKMLKAVIPLVAIILHLLFAGSVRAQESPVQVSTCDLASHPKSYEGKTIRVRGALSVGFEIFTLSVARDCNTQQEIWIAFGGDVPGVVPSTINDNFRKPGVDLRVNGVSYRIKKDESFRRLYALIAFRHGEQPAHQVTATLTGVFYAGRERKFANGASNFGGYGHLGCCSLFVITQVAEVESVPPANLDLRGTLLDPDGKPIKGIVVIDDIVGGTPPERQQMVTDGQGDFEFPISGQLIRIEDANYRPIALAVEPGGSPVQVKLEEAKASDWIARPCAAETHHSKRVGFSVLFSLPATLRSSRFDFDDSRSYFIFRRGDDSSNARFVITKNASRQTYVTDAIDSDWSEQRWIKENTGNIIGIDARGRLKTGAQWRVTTFWGSDAASYRVDSAEEAKLSDQVIDSACIAK